MEVILYIGSHDLILLTAIFTWPSIMINDFKFIDHILLYSSAADSPWLDC